MQGGNLAATANLTLPPFVRMQDLKPADGIEVLIITDSVSLLGTNGTKKTEDNPHIHEKLWPILSSNFKNLAIKAISVCTTQRMLKEVKELVKAKAGGDPAAFKHVLIIMPTLNELCKNGHETIDQRNILHPRWFKELGETLKPMKYKMVIGPGSAEKWKITGKQSFDEMGAELYKEFIPAVNPQHFHGQRLTHFIGICLRNSYKHTASVLLCWKKFVPAN